MSENISGQKNPVGDDFINQFLTGFFCYRVVNHFFTPETS